MNKDLNIDLNSIKAKLMQLPIFIKRYAVVIFIVSVMGVYGFLVWQINSLSNIPANEERIAQERQVIKRPQVDENIVRKIEQLEDQNVAVQSLFKAARDNPFKDN